VCSQISKMIFFDKEVVDQQVFYGGDPGIDHLSMG
jgi:hypothetical protein